MRPLTPCPRPTPLIPWNITAKFRPDAPMRMPNAMITDGSATILYRGHGRGGPGGLREGVTFETDSEGLAWLNDTVAVGVGSLDGASLSIELYQVS